MDKYHVFLANLHVTVGLMKGRTVLPLPPTETSEKSSKDRVHVLEGAVIMWTKQIRYVLKQDPETPLKAGLNPDPLVEVEFWKNKASNLNSVHDQLLTDGVNKVLKFLEQNKSTYTNPFAKLKQEVEKAREEANDTLRFLNTLKPLLEKLTDEGSDFVELVKLFEPMMHLLLLIWTHSKFYNTPARLVVLIREICNTIITQAL